MAAPAAAKPHVDQRNAAYTLGLIALIVAVFALAVAYAIDAASRSWRLAPHRADTETTLQRTIGGRDLTIPLAWFRAHEGNTESFSRSVDLQLVLPLGPSDARRTIDVTLVPRSSVWASARLLDGVYLHLFETGEAAGPPGLIGKPLKAVDGYASETVWYDPIAADPFVAKCSAPVRRGGTGKCLRVVYVAPALAAIYRFDSDVLDNWRSFDDRLMPLLEGIGATGG